MQHFAVVLLLIGCSSPAPVASNTGTRPVVSPVPDAVTLKDLQDGDRACYVIVIKGSDEKSFEGDFALCKGGAKDATALIGKQITYTTKKAKVLATSCEGNMDCGKSDEVDLIDSISAAP